MRTVDQQVNKKTGDAPRRSLLLRIWHGVVSFVVGVSAFFVFKLLVMIPLNLLMTARNRELMDGIGALLFIFCIYLAIKFTKYLNAGQSTKRLVIVKVVTVILGFFAMTLSTVFLALSRGASA